MKTFKLLSAITLTTVLSSPVLADDDDDSSCTAAAINAAEAYDPGMGSVTTCIEERDDVEVIVAWNNNLKNGKIFNTTGATVSQQAVNVRNLARDYEKNYGMEHSDEFDIVVVAYAAGVDWLRKSSEQANQDFITNEVLKRGIKIYACQNTMKAKKLKLSDLIDGVETVPAGVTAVVDFQKQGRTYLLP